MKRIGLLSIFFLSLTLANSVYGMYDRSGNWICSDADIELSYYEFYTNELQTKIDDMYSKEGLDAARLYLNEIIMNPESEQNWKKSQECLISLGMDAYSLPTIGISDLRIIEERKDIVVKEEVKGEITEPITEPSISFDYDREIENYERGYGIEIVVGAIVFIIIVGTAYFFHQKSKSKNDKKEKRDQPNIEIDIDGGIEK